MAGRRFVVVERHAGDRSLLETLLSAQGGTVTAFESPEAASMELCGENVVPIVNIETFPPSSWAGVVPFSNCFCTASLGRPLSRDAEAANFAGMLFQPFRASDIYSALEGVAANHFSPNSATEDSRPPLRVLVAEDNPVNQTLMRRMLERDGHDVVIAANGREAVEHWERSRHGIPFDIVLMDVQMPEMDGFAAAHAIRSAEEQGCRLPILALTAHAGDDDHARCLNCGMEGMITKPVKTRRTDAPPSGTLPRA